MTRLLLWLSGFVGLWPRWLVRLCAWALGCTLFSVVRYRRAVLLENLALAFADLSPKERRRLGRAAMVHLARTLIEFLQIPRYVRRGFTNLTVEGRAHYEAAKAQGRGVLILAGHLGSFEVGASGTAFQLRPDEWCLVVKPFPEALDRFVNQLRAGAGLQPVHAKGGLKGVLRALKKQQAAVFVIDQNATKHVGVFVEFFGKQACTMAGLAVVAQRTGAPVIPVGIWREADGSHVLRMYPELRLEAQGTRQETVVHMTQLYTRFIEEQIRAHPEQWLWTHRRWKTRPPDAGEG